MKGSADGHERGGVLNEVEGKGEEGRRRQQAGVSESSQT